MTEALRTVRFDKADALFADAGSAWMMLTRPAAAEAISCCSAKGIAVSIVEAGIWHEPGFEARLDGIWHSEFDAKSDVDCIDENNSRALQFIVGLPQAYDTAIISTFGNEV
ncbi:hypothetical protein [Aurantiacibacter gilvus]|uniref:Uncharacterized protein n=1 Tax=Aurantiacibacter gilvus TaxID=3139141 RepID=A0ABU9IAK8_9SPHN